MKTIKLLDCTLRDGGYINNWNFGIEGKKEILKSLTNSHIDIIECGLLTCDKNISSEQTLYNSLAQVNNIIPNNKAEYTVMVNYGTVDINKFPQNQSNIEIRLAFKPHEIDNAINYSKELIQKGYIISLNPMHTSIYSMQELKKLLNKSNDIMPRCITVVDTMGIMTKNDTKNIFNILDKYTDNQIALGFHSHNNMNLSFKNTQTLLGMNLDRCIIIDSCLSGMGRGAGILSTQDIAEYINQYYNKEYSTEQLNQIANKYIEPLKHLWKSKDTYYLSAKNKCHPNYAKDIIDNMNILCNDNKIIDMLLKRIPEKNKILYDKTIIPRLIKELQNV